MAVYKYNDVESVLLKKGFEQKPGDHKVKEGGKDG